MRELKRILVDDLRLKRSFSQDNFLALTNDESHYLYKVLRLRKGDMVCVIDGLGRSWEASFNSSKFIQLHSTFESPLERKKRPKTLICLAVVIPKKGFEDLLRMSCEIGIDVIQRHLNSSGATGYIRLANELLDRFLLNK